MSLSPQSVSAIRAQLWDAGFRPVPILNADAPGPSPGKRPLGNAWREDALKDPPFCVTVPAVSHALNTGILADQLRPIDIDIDDPGMARRVRSMALDRFGETSIRRRGNSERSLLLYRAEIGAPPKIAITGAAHTAANGCKVEVLGAGQQFVAFGRHDSGADLEWFPEAPGEVSADQLPSVSEEGILAFLTDVAALIVAEPPSRPNGKDHYPASNPQADPLRLAAALSALPNAGPADWEWWNKVGMALFNATDGSAIGGELFNEWSRRNPAYDLKETEERWHHYRRSPADRLGAGTIFYLAGGAFRPEPEMEEPPSSPEDPAWWSSLEQHMVDYQEVANSEEAPEIASSPDAIDGLVINPPIHWTAPAPLRQWLIDQWIPIGYVTGLYGDGGVGKSLIAQQLLCSVALRLPWLGLDVTGGRAFGFMCEDDASELHRRQEGINRAYGVNMAHLENLRIAARLGFDNLLMTFDADNRGKPTGIYAEICEYLDKWRPKLVVLDTLADIFGGREIERTHARQFVQGIGGNLARKYDCAVVIPAHPSASGLSTGSGTSGSTAWNNTFRSRLYITRPEGDTDSDTRLISRMKSNYAPKGGEITASWQDGAFGTGGPIRERPEIEWAHIDAIFQEIDRAWKSGDPWSAEPQSKRQSRYIATWASIALGLDEKKVGRIVQKWVINKFLMMQTISAKNHHRGLRVLRWMQSPSVPDYPDY